MEEGSNQLSILLTHSNKLALFTIQTCIMLRLIPFLPFLLCPILHACTLPCLAHFLHLINYG